MGKEHLDKNVLLDQMKIPNNDVLKNILGKKYKLYMEFANELEKRDLYPEWKFYNDTKSWLCRTLKGKKNYCWLSVVNSGIKLTFYFNKETINGIYKLEINQNIKEFAKDQEIGRKNPPVSVVIENKNNFKKAKGYFQKRLLTIFFKN
jgi:hypothetical protein